MNAEGYGIHKEIRREAKEIQNELANMNLDGWVGNLVTAMEEIDFTDVAVRRANVAIEILAGGITRSPGSQWQSHVGDRHGCARERLGVTYNEKCQTQQ